MIIVHCLDKIDYWTYKYSMFQLKMLSCNNLMFLKNCLSSLLVFYKISLNFPLPIIIVHIVNWIQFGLAMTDFLPNKAINVTRQAWLDIFIILIPRQLVQECLEKIYIPSHEKSSNKGSNQILEIDTKIEVKLEIENF